MRILNASHRVNIEKDRLIINILGEVCWGFHINNFENKIGAKKEIVEELLERLLRYEKNGIIEIFLNNSEVEIIKSAFNEVKSEIEEWEFHARIGATLDEVKEISIFN